MLCDLKLTVGLILDKLEKFEVEHCTDHNFILKPISLFENFGKNNYVWDRFG